MKTPFCKVCFDTGKPESLYTSHYVNDLPGKKGVVVCPTLLALECRYCKQTGHTVSRCNVISDARKRQFAKRRMEEKKQQHVPVPVPVPVVEPPRANINRYMVLENDEVAREKTASPVSTTYASIVCTTAGDVPPPPPPLRLFVPRSPSTSPPPLVVRKKMHWADYSSDSENDSD